MCTRHKTNRLDKKKQEKTTRVVFKMSDSNDLLNHICRKGKNISVQLTITDSDKAADLMSTMHPNSEASKNNIFGVEVDSWGNFNIEKAQEYRLQLIREEVFRHKERMEFLTDSNNLQNLFEESQLVDTKKSTLDRIECNGTGDNYGFFEFSLGTN